MRLYINHVMDVVAAGEARGVTVTVSEDLGDFHFGLSVEGDEGRVLNFLAELGYDTPCEECATRTEHSHADGTPTLAEMERDLRA